MVPREMAVEETADDPVEFRLARSRLQAFGYLKVDGEFAPLPVRLVPQSKFILALQVVQSALRDFHGRAAPAHALFDPPPQLGDVFGAGE